MNIKQAAADKGYILPRAPQPVGNYKATLISGNRLYVSGQMPIRNGEMIYAGKLGDTLSVVKGQEAAKLAALNLLSQLDAALGERQLKSVLRLEGYINASANFTEHASVLNGASDLLAEVLGDRAGHVRTVFGCNSLPMGAAVEITAIVALD